MALEQEIEDFLSRGRPNRGPMHKGNLLCLVSHILTFRSI